MKVHPLRPPPKRPPEIIYGVDEVPPLHVIVLSGLQHVGLIAIFLIFPIIVINEVGLPASHSANVLSLAVIALGVAALLQGIPKGPVGSGFLCPANYSAIYLAPSIASVKMGGLPLLFGMTVFAGVLEAALSPLLHRIRSLFPPELSGLVVFFVGTTVGSLGVRYLIGVGVDTPLTRNDILVAAIALGVTAGLNVWGRGQARVFCALIGMIAGYGASVLTGVLPLDALENIHSLPLMAFPTVDHISWSFSSALALPFVISALVATVKTVAVITACQRINDVNWVRPEMRSLSSGVLADGLGTISSGVLGSMGVNSSPTSVALSAATGITSRAVGFAAGALLIGLGFFPKIIGLLVLMPRPVVGSLLVFVASFILVNGIQTMAARMLDARRTLVIGLAASAGITAELVPNVGWEMPFVIQPILTSSLVLGTTTALALHVLFRFGQRQRAILEVDPAAADASKQVADFIEDCGKAWGARRDVMERVSFGMKQAIEAAREFSRAGRSIRIGARFDEFNVDINLTYEGELIPLPERRPSNEEIIESEDGHLKLAGFMLRRNADGVTASRSGDESVLQFHFDH
jgi:xanthine permease XanP